MDEHQFYVTRGLALARLGAVFVAFYYVIFFTLLNILSKSPKFEVLHSFTCGQVRVFFAIFFVWSQISQISTFSKTQLSKSTHLSG